MDTIAAIGPGNHYLTHRQTQAHYHEQRLVQKVSTEKKL